MNYVCRQGAGKGCRPAEGGPRPAAAIVLPRACGDCPDTRRSRVLGIGGVGRPSYSLDSHSAGSSCDAHLGNGEREPYLLVYPVYPFFLARLNGHTQLLSAGTCRVWIHTLPSPLKRHTSPSPERNRDL